MSTGTPTPYAGLNQWKLDDRLLMDEFNADNQKIDQALSTLAVSGIQGPKGDKGDPGPQGENGLSAYELAVERGFVGTEEEWLESLRGGTDDTGSQGNPGADGNNTTINGFDTLTIIDSDTVTAEINAENNTIKFTSWLEGNPVPRINMTLQTVDDFGENGNETIAIQANEGSIQHTKTDADGVFTNKFVKTDTPYTFSVTELPESLMGKTISNPSKSLTTGTLDLPLDVKLEYVRTDLANPQYVDLMNDIISGNAGKEYSLDVSTFGSLTGTGKWDSGVLAPNGKIYGMPRDSTAVLEIDPERRTASTFGSLTGTRKWSGGVLAPNGKIYGIPLDSTAVLEIDPQTRTTSTFGSLTGIVKWLGGVLAPNGKIYGIPFQSTSVLEIDPETRTVSTFGSVGSGTSKWYGGVLAPNGKIYGIPRDSTTVLEIDPETRTTSTFGGLTGTKKWAGGVLAPNGKIYGMPQDSTAILEIDPETRTASTFGSLIGTDKWVCGVLAPNGKIYGMPLDSTAVLEIDPQTRTVSTFGSVGSATFKWIGGVLAPNGKIYGMPYNSATILEINLSGLTNFGPTALRSAYINSF